MLGYIREKNIFMEAKVIYLSIINEDLKNTLCNVKTYKNMLYAANENLLKKIESNSKKYKNEYPDYPDAEDRYANDFFNIEMFNDFSNELLVVLCYKVCEQYLKKILFAFTNKNANCDIRVLIAEFLKIKVNLKIIDSWEVIEKIRLINNCIKHNNSIVSSELSKKDGKLKKSEKIKLSSDDIDSFLEKINSFFKSLIAKITLSQSDIAI